MKKLFDRLRRWLIKKLGGYTEQFQLIPRQITETPEVQVQKVSAQISVAPLDSTLDFKEYCENNVLRLLMRELCQPGFILWERQDDAITQKVNVRATLCVVNANDLTPRFQWVE